MKNFRKKKILSQETLGEYLRKVRQGQNWTLEVAAQKSKISAHYLSALEKSQYDKIPGEVYITNFIKVYSKRLGLDPNKTFDQYNLEKHIIEQKKHHRFLNEIGQLKIIDFLLKPKTIKISAICIAVVIMLSYITFSIYQTIAPPMLDILYPLDDIETYELIIEVKGKSDQEAHVTINNQEIILKADGSFEEDVPLRNGLNLLVIRAKKRHGFEKKAVRHVLVNPDQPIAKY